MRIRWIWLPLIALAFGGMPAAGAAELTISAAISLREVFQKIAAAFEADHPGDRVALNFASSGHLQQQIERGVPADVFASAGVRPMDALARQGLLLTGTRRIFATNRLVLIRPKGGEAVRSFASLGAGFHGRLVIGNPRHVPAGIYAKETLESLGYWKGLASRVVFAEHVRQVLDYVVRGEVDAGLVYRTDAVLAREKVEIVEEAPPGSHKRIEYPIAVLRDTGNSAAARGFVDFVQGSRARAILAEFGFEAP